ncbi:hypothetical protein Btru_023123 [Bulinus truncatus]|nr:hypothetical protein Btru_023123 [Bulinus truncatus]
MFGCCLRPRSDAEIAERPILDVGSILQDYVWEKFVQDQSKMIRKCLRREQFVVDVPMNYFLFETYKQKITPRVRPETGKIPGQSHNNSHGGQDNKAGHGKNKKDQLGDKQSSTVQIATDFFNNTDVPQTYKFRLEKTRKAALQVSFQKGFTVNGNARFTLGLPSLVGQGSSELSAGVTISVSKATGEVIEESVVLEVTSDIQVEKRSKFVAKVVMAESHVIYDFKVHSRMSMPTGGAPGYVVRKKDNRIFFSLFIKNLEDVFKSYQRQISVVDLETDHPTKMKAVELETRGVLEGVRLSDQMILLDSFPLPSPTRAAPVYKVDDHPDKKPTGVDYVPIQTYTSLPFRTPSLDTPVIEEVDEDENNDNSSFPGSADRRLVAPIGTIPSIHTTAPSSTCSSPLSEKEHSDASDTSKSTTVFGHLIKNLKTFQPSGQTMAKDDHLANWSNNGSRRPFGQLVKQRPTGLTMAQDDHSANWSNNGSR